MHTLRLQRGESPLRSTGVPPRAGSATRARSTERKSREIGLPNRGARTSASASSLVHAGMSCTGAMTAVANPNPARPQTSPDQELEHPQQTDAYWMQGLGQLKAPRRKVFELTCDGVKSVPLALLFDKPKLLTHEAPRRSVELIRLLNHEARKRHRTRASLQQRASGEVARHAHIIFREAREDIMAAMRKCCIVMRFLKYMEQGVRRRRLLRGSMQERLPALRAKNWSVGSFGVLLQQAQKRHGGKGRGYRHFYHSERSEHAKADFMWDKLTCETKFSGSLTKSLDKEPLRDMLRELN